MRSLNILRAVVFAIAAGFLIFVQDHSITVGMSVLQFVTAALAFGGVVLYKLEDFSKAKSVLVVPTAIAAVVALLTITIGGLDPASPDSRLGVFRLLVGMFAGTMAIAEFVFSQKETKGERLELRISSALGLITLLVFVLAPLDPLNSVGLLSAYLSLSAVQRAIWAAGPNERKKKKNA